MSLAFEGPNAKGTSALSRWSPRHPSPVTAGVPGGVTASGHVNFPQQQQ